MSVTQMSQVQRKSAPVNYMACWFQPVTQSHISNHLLNCKSLWRVIQGAAEHFPGRQIITSGLDNPQQWSDESRLWALSHLWEIICASQIRQTFIRLHEEYIKTYWCSVDQVNYNYGEFSRMRGGTSWALRLYHYPYSP